MKRLFLSGITLQPLKPKKPFRFSTTDDSLCNHGVSVQQPNERLRKMASHRNLQHFVLDPFGGSCPGNFLSRFCNKSSNEGPEAASTNDSLLNPDSDRLFKFFGIQATGPGHISEKVILDFEVSDFLHQIVLCIRLVLFLFGLGLESKAPPMSFFSTAEPDSDEPGISPQSLPRSVPHAALPMLHGF